MAPVSFSPFWVGTVGLGIVGIVVSEWEDKRIRTFEEKKRDLKSLHNEAIEDVEEKRSDKIIKQIIESLKDADRSQGVAVKILYQPSLADKEE